MLHTKLLWVFMLFFFHQALSQKTKALKFLQIYQEKLIPVFSDQYKAIYTRATNITDYNSRVQNMKGENTRLHVNNLQELARKINLSDSDEDTSRQLRMFLTTKTSKNTSVAREKARIGTEMINAYSMATIRNDRHIIKSIDVGDGVTELTLDKHLRRIMAESNDPRELLYVWKSWRDNAGNAVKDLYSEFVRLNNIGAVEHGYTDAGEYRRKLYEVDNLEAMAEDFLEDMKPFYYELYSYVRYKLSKIYPDDIDVDGLMPAHLLGNMWAQNWESILNKVVPYPGEPTLDVSPTLKKKYSVKKMFKEAERFFVSLGWSKLPKTFWKHSMLVQPKKRKVQCHASAWDMLTKDNGEPDVRVKMCTKKTQEDFITIHHELGHIYYYLLYWNQPLEYRDGANPGFHEAVGDTLALSVQTPAHLNAIGLLPTVSQTKEADINFLMKTALQFITFLPFGYLMDKWMWNVYKGNIRPSEYNSKWWEYRRKYQGIKSPIERSERNFDPGAKFHIPADTSYIRYFFAHILQFTFHDQACKLAGNKKPLHQCSIYKSKKAGKAFGDMLALGKSKHWQFALEQFTGSKNISTEPIKQYFKPLIRWLRSYREKHAYKLGWDTEDADNHKEKKNLKSKSNKKNI